MNIKQALEEQLSGDVIEIVNDEFAIGTYGIEGKPGGRSHSFVFRWDEEKQKLFQFCVVSPGFRDYLHWYKLRDIENAPDVDAFGNDQIHWRESNKRFKALI